MLCTKRCPYLPGLGVLDAPICFNIFFYELRLYVRRHIIYCDWWLSWQWPNALMIVSKVYQIAIQKHLLPSVHYSDVNVNICISTESTMFESWILKLFFASMWCNLHNRWSIKTLQNYFRQRETQMIADLTLLTHSKRLVEYMGQRTRSSFVWIKSLSPTSIKPLSKQIPRYPGNIN